MDELPLTSAVAGPSWHVSKRPVVSSRGVIAAQHRLAAEAGAAILREGGNAIDAAIAAALAVGVVEPWLSGIGGGGFMMVRTARDDRVYGVDFGMIAARRLDPARYALVGGQDLDWFQWPKVIEDRNIIGYESIAVPGAIAGFELVAERFGRLKWRDLVAPALSFAEAGMPVDWYASLSIAVDAAGLEPFPASRAVFMPDGQAPVTRDRSAQQRLANPALARTLKRLAEAGPRDFYEGEIARSLVNDLAAGGSVISADDLAAYRARIVTPATLDYRGTRLHVMPGLSGGPTYLAALSALAAGPKLRGPDAEAFLAYAKAITEAYATRLSTYGHAGVTNDPGCTTHVSVIDAEGNMVALTNSLLSRFGAKTVMPETGILMNNGMMWFDPVPGKPNSIEAGKRPLTNMCPVIGTRNGKGWFAIGGSGGRKILPAILQICSFISDFGMTLEEAFHQPRIDVSAPDKATADWRLDAKTIAAVSKVVPTTEVEAAAYPGNFANPIAVMRNGKTNEGMTNVTLPAASVAMG